MKYNKTKKLLGIKFFFLLLSLFKYFASQLWLALVIQVTREIRVNIIEKSG
jgi:hypothetical protein